MLELLNFGKIRSEHEQRHCYAKSISVRLRMVTTG